MNKLKTYIIGMMLFLMPTLASAFDQIHFCRALSGGIYDPHIFAYNAIIKGQNAGVGIICDKPAEGTKMNRIYENPRDCIKEPNQRMKQINEQLDESLIIFVRKCGYGPEL